MTEISQEKGRTKMRYLLLPLLFLITFLGCSDTEKEREKVAAELKYCFNSLEADIYITETYINLYHKTGRGGCANCQKQAHEYLSKATEAKRNSEITAAKCDALAIKLKELTRK